MLNIIDEFTHECLAIRVDRRLKSIDVIDVLSDLFILRGVPGHIRSDNGRSSSRRPCRSGSRRLGPRQPTSRRARPGETASSRASTPGCATSCSTARSSTAWRRRRSSSRAGGGTTTRCARMDRSDTSRRHRRSSYPPWPCGRLRNPFQLRRPRWRRGRQCTNIPTGPLSGGRSIMLPFPERSAKKDLGSFHFLSAGLTAGQLLVPSSACETLVRCHGTDDVQCRCSTRRC